MKVYGELESAQLEALASDPANAPRGRVYLNTASGIYKFYDGSGWKTLAMTANKLSVFAATSSAELASVISDETGSGALVFATSPTLVTPVLGTPSSGTLTSCTGLPLTTGVTGTLPVANGGTGTTTSQGTGSVVLSSGATITSAALVTPTVDGVGIGFSGSTSGTSILRAAAVAGGSMVIPSGTDTLVAAAQTQTLQNKTLTSPVLTTPALGTPASGVLTSCTGLPLTTGVTGTLPLGNGGTGQTTAAAAFKSLAAYSAKGQVPGYDGSATGVLSVGADGTVLTADAASTYGIKWGTAFVNPMATTGDMVYGGVSGASTKLATGATAGVLTGGNGAVPAWSTSLAGTYTIGTAGSSTQTINGLGLLSYSDAQTSANSNNSHEMRRLSTGTAAVGFGGRLRLSLQNASGTTTDGAALTWTWTNATASSEAATLAFETRTAGGALSTKGSVTGTGNWTLGTGTSNSHTFNGDLNSTGTATIGSTSGTTARHTIQAQPASLSTQVLDLKKQSFTKNQNNNIYIACVASDGDEGYLQTNGSAVLGITDVSDQRLKKNVRDAEYGLETIMALRPVTFDWIVGPPNVKGFIAQEVKTVLPESVSILDQSDKEDGFADAHFLETATMIPVLVRAVQELKAELESLKATKAK